MDDGRLVTLFRDDARHHRGGPVDRRPRLQRQIRGAERHLQQCTVPVGAEQSLADERVVERGDLLDLQVRLVGAQACQCGGEGVDEGEVVVVERAVGAFEGEDQTAGVDVLRERLLEQPVAANAGAAGGQEADVVVLGAAVPRGGDDGQAHAERQPGSADEPRVPGREPADGGEHPA
ncbi:MAG: hypothetical protein U0736_03960 [Gemmataceae bacterium]